MNWGQGMGRVPSFRLSTGLKTAFLPGTATSPHSIKSQPISYLPPVNDPWSEWRAPKALLGNGLKAARPIRAKFAVYRPVA